jgi:cyclophilin family peptidyl-prolyl cis-trans isomerase
MNRKEKEKFDIATGKKQMNPEEIARRQEIEQQEKVLNRKRWMVILGSMVVVILVIVGISAFFNQKELAKEDKASWPPGVEKPSKTEIAQIKNEIVHIDTDKGLIKLELYPESAPLTVNNFRKLIREGTYDNSTFHRVIYDFMIQAGQTKMVTGEDGQETEMPINVGYEFKDEINPWSLGLTDEQVEAIQSENPDGGYKYDKELQSYPIDYGYLCMANAGPNTNGAQFFIVTKKDGCEWLYGRHTVFGKVIEGMDIAEEIQNVETGPNDAPVDPVMIKRVWIEEKPTE